MPTQRSSAEVFMKQTSNFASKSSHENDELQKQKESIHLNYKTNASSTSSSSSTESDSEKMEADISVNSNNQHGKNDEKSTSSALSGEEEYYASYEPRLDFPRTPETKGLAYDEIFQGLLPAALVYSSENHDNNNVLNLQDEVKLQTLNEFSNILEKDLDAKQRTSSESSDDSSWNKNNIRKFQAGLSNRSSENEEKTNSSNLLDKTIPQDVSKYSKINKEFLDVNQQKISDSSDKLENDVLQKIRPANLKKKNRNSIGESSDENVKDLSLVKKKDISKKHHERAPLDNKSSSIATTPSGTIATVSINKTKVRETTSSESSDEHPHKFVPTFKMPKLFKKEKKVGREASSSSENSDNEATGFVSLSAGDFLQDKVKIRKSSSSESSTDEDSTKQKQGSFNKPVTSAIVREKSFSQSGDEQTMGVNAASDNVLNITELRKKSSSESSSESSNDDESTVHILPKQIERQFSNEINNTQEPTDGFAPRLIADVIQKTLEHRESSSSESNDENSTKIDFAKAVIESTLTDAKSRKSVSSESGSERSHEKDTKETLEDFFPQAGKQSEESSSDSSDNESISRSPTVTADFTAIEKINRIERSGSESSVELSIVETPVVVSMDPAIKLRELDKDSSSESSEEQSETDGLPSQVSIINAKTAKSHQASSSESSDENVEQVTLEKLEIVGKNVVESLSKKPAVELKRSSSESSDEHPHKFVPTFKMPKLFKKEKKVGREASSSSENSDNEATGFVSLSAGDFLQDKVKIRKSSSSESSTDEDSTKQKQGSFNKPVTSAIVREKSFSQSGDEQTMGVNAASDNVLNITELRKKSSSESSSESSNDDESAVHILPKQIERQFSNEINNTQEPTDGFAPRLIADVIQKTLEHRESSSSESNDENSTKIDFAKAVIESTLTDAKSRKSVSSESGSERSHEKDTKETLEDFFPQAGKQSEESSSDSSDNESISRSPTVTADFTAIEKINRIERSGSESSVELSIVETPVVVSMDPTIKLRELDKDSSSESSEEQSETDGLPSQVSIINAKTAKSHQASSSESSDENVEQVTLEKLEIVGKNVVESLSKKPAVELKRSSSESSDEHPHKFVPTFKMPKLFKKEKKVGREASSSSENSDNEATGFVSLSAGDFLQDKVKIRKSSSSESSTDEDSTKQKQGSFNKPVTSAIVREKSFSQSGDEQTMGVNAASDNVLNITELRKKSSSESSSESSNDDESTVHILPKQIERQFSNEINNTQEPTDGFAPRLIADVIQKTLEHRESSSSESNDENSTKIDFAKAVIESTLTDAKSRKSVSSESGSERSHEKDTKETLEDFFPQAGKQSEESSSDSSDNESISRSPTVTADFTAIEKINRIERSGSESSVELSIVETPVVVSMDPAIKLRELDKDSSSESSEEQSETDGLPSQVSIINAKTAKSHQASSSESSDENVEQVTLEKLEIVGKNVVESLSKKPAVELKRSSSESSDEHPHKFVPTFKMPKLFKKEKKVGREASSSSENSDNEATGFVSLSAGDFLQDKVKIRKSSSSESSTDEDSTKQKQGSFNKPVTSAIVREKSFSQSGDEQTMGVNAASDNVLNITELRKKSSSESSSESSNDDESAVHILPKQIERQFSNEINNTQEPTDGFAPRLIADVIQKTLEHRESSSSESNDENSTKIDFAKAVIESTLTDAKSRKSVSSESGSERSHEKDTKETLEDFFPQAGKQSEESSSDSSDNESISRSPTVTADFTAIEKINRIERSGSESSVELSIVETPVVVSMDPTIKLRELDKDSSSESSEEQSETDGLPSQVSIINAKTAKSHQASSSESSDENVEQVTLEKLEIVGKNVVESLSKKPAVELKRSSSESSDEHPHKFVPTFKMPKLFKKEKKVGREASSSSENSDNEATGFVSLSAGDFLQDKVKIRKSSSSESSTDEDSTKQKQGSFNKPVTSAIVREKSFSQSGDEQTMGVNAASDNVLNITELRKKSSSESSSESSNDDESAVHILPKQIERQFSNEINNTQEPTDGFAPRLIADVIQKTLEHRESSSSESNDENSTKIDFAKAVIESTLTDAKSRKSVSSESGSERSHEKDTKETLEDFFPQAGKQSEESSSDSSDNESISRSPTVTADFTAIEKINRIERSGSESSVELSIVETPVVVSMDPAIKLRELDKDSSSESSEEQSETDGLPSQVSIINAKTAKSHQASSSESSDENVEQVTLEKLEIVGKNVVESLSKKPAVELKRSSSESSDEHPHKFVPTFKMPKLFKKEKKVGREASSSSENSDNEATGFVSLSAGDFLQDKVKIRKSSSSESSTDEDSTKQKQGSFNKPVTSAIVREKSFSQSGDEQTMGVNAASDNVLNITELRKKSSSESSSESSNDDESAVHILPKQIERQFSNEINNTQEPTDGFAPRLIADVIQKTLEHRESSSSESNDENSTKIDFAKAVIESTLTDAKSRKSVSSESGSERSHEKDTKETLEDFFPQAGKQSEESSSDSSDNESISRSPTVTADFTAIEKINRIERSGSESSVELSIVETPVVVSMDPAIKLRELDKDSSSESSDEQSETDGLPSQVSIINAKTAKSHQASSSESSDENVEQVTLEKLEIVGKNVVESLSKKPAVELKRSSSESSDEHPHKFVPTFKMPKLFKKEKKVGREASSSSENSDNEATGFVSISAGDFLQDKVKIRKSSSSESSTDEDSTKQKQGSFNKPVTSAIVREKSFSQSGDEQTMGVNAASDNVLNITELRKKSSSESSSESSNDDESAVHILPKQIERQFSNKINNTQEPTDGFAPRLIADVIQKTLEHRESSSSESNDENSTKIDFAKAVIESTLTDAKSRKSVSSESGSERSHEKDTKETLEDFFPQAGKQSEESSSDSSDNESISRSPTVTADFTAIEKINRIERSGSESSVELSIVETPVVVSMDPTIKLRELDKDSSSESSDEQSETDGLPSQVSIINAKTAKSHQASSSESSDENVEQVTLEKLEIVGKNVVESLSKKPTVELKRSSSESSDEHPHKFVPTFKMPKLFKKEKKVGREASSSSENSDNEATGFVSLSAGDFLQDKVKIRKSSSSESSTDEDSTKQKQGSFNKPVTSAIVREKSFSQSGDEQTMGVNAASDNVLNITELRKKSSSESSSESSNDDESAVHILPKQIERQFSNEINNTPEPTDGFAPRLIADVIQKTLEHRESSSSESNDENSTKIDFAKAVIESTLTDAKSRKSVSSESENSRKQFDSRNIELDFKVGLHSSSSFSDQETKNGEETKNTTVRASVASMTQFFQRKIDSTQPSPNVNDKRLFTIKKEATAMGRLIASFQKKGNNGEFSSIDSSSNDDNSYLQKSVSSGEHLDNKILKSFGQNVGNHSQSSSETSSDESSDCQKKETPKTKFLEDNVNSGDAFLDSISGSSKVLEESSFEYFNKQVKAASEDYLLLDVVSDSLQKQAINHSRSSSESNSDNSSDHQLEIVSKDELLNDVISDSAYAQLSKRLRSSSTSSKEIDKEEAVASLDQNNARKKFDSDLFSKQFEKHEKLSSESSYDQHELEQKETIFKENIHYEPTRNNRLTVPFATDSNVTMEVRGIEKATKLAGGSKKMHRNTQSDSESSSLSDNDNISKETQRKTKKKYNPKDDVVTVNKSIQNVHTSLKESLARVTKLTKSIVLPSEAKKARSSSNCSSNENDYKYQSEIICDELNAKENKENEHIKSDDSDNSSSSSGDSGERRKTIPQKSGDDKMDDFELIDDAYEKQVKSVFPSYDMIMEEIQDNQIIEDEPRFQHPIDPALATIEEDTDEPVNSLHKIEEHCSSSSSSSSSNDSSSEESSAEVCL